MDVFFGGPSRDVRRRQIALVESANLVRLESPDHGVKDAAVMEENEIPLFPVVGVDQLRVIHYVSVYGQARIGGARMNNETRTHLWRNSGALELVEKRANLAEILEMGTVRVQSTFPFGTLGQGSYDKFLDTTGMHLEV